MNDDIGTITVPYIKSKLFVEHDLLSELFNRLDKLEKQVQELEMFVLMKDKNIRRDMRAKICANLRGEERMQALKALKEAHGDD